MATQTQETQVTQLATSRFEMAEAMRNSWQALPEFGTPIDAMLDPRYWAHVAAKLKRGDHIYALAEDDSYHAAFIVLDVGKLYAKVVKIPGLCFSIDGGQQFTIKLPKGYDIKFRGPQKKWVALRGDDEIMSKPSKIEIEAWLEEHLAAIAPASSKAA